VTLADFQAQLKSLGYAPGPIDGIWGDQTGAAVDAFMDDYAPGDFWDTVKYFARSEFACKCGKCGGFPAEPAETLVRVIDDIRQRLGKPIMVSSGVRCESHNAEVGGVYNSRHLSGHAVDFACPGVPQAEVMALIAQYPDIKYYYAIDKEYIHMDIGG